MNNVYLLTGSNLGKRKKFLFQALEEIGKTGKIVKVSSLYESRSWGYNSKNLFINQAVQVQTSYDPSQLLQFTKRIERDTGRPAGTKTYSDRSIDIDILLYGHLNINLPDLTIPHPRLHLRLFALIPLREISPELIHPVFGKTIRDLVAECPDNIHPVKIKPV